MTPHLLSCHSRLLGRLHVANTGSRAGGDVIEVYVHYPRGAGEPPEQLKAFVPVTLAPHTSRDVVFVISRWSLAIYPRGVAVVVPGTYRLDVGSSSATLTLHARVPVA